MTEVLAHVLVGWIVFWSAVLIDFAHARYARARDTCQRHAAARWSVLQWLAACVGFVAAVRWSLYFLPVEAAGLYLGTYLGAPSVTGVRLVREAGNPDGRQRLDLQ